MTRDNEIRELERLAKLAWPSLPPTVLADRTGATPASVGVCGDDRDMLYIEPHPRNREALLAALRVLAGEPDPALTTAQARIKELERDLNDQLKVESDRDAEISVERQRRMTAELQNGRDAARIRDLEARIKELEERYAVDVGDRIATEIRQSARIRDLEARLERAEKVVETAREAAGFVGQFNRCLDLVMALAAYDATQPVLDDGAAR
jgi:vacuolar-type H+-ATPase subunit I/STV1